MTVPCLQKKMELKMLVKQAGSQNTKEVIVKVFVLQLKILKKTKRI